MEGPANITDPERCDKEPSGQAANAISRDEQRHEQQQCCGCKNPKSERWGETFCCFVHAVLRSGFIALGRQSVGQGKSVSVSVDLEGRRFTKNKKTNQS